MKTLSVLALSVIVGLSVSPRLDAAAQFNQGRDRGRGDQVCVYKDINFQGQEQCYGPGEVSNLGALRQSISSIRVYGRATVTVYENTDFRGRSAQFNSDVADLGRAVRFYTETLGLEKERIAVTVFAGDDDAPRDDEAIAVWRSLGICKLQVTGIGRRGWRGRSASR